MQSFYIERSFIFRTTRRVPFGDRGLFKEFKSFTIQTRLRALGTDIGREIVEKFTDRKKSMGLLYKGTDWNRPGSKRSHTKSFPSLAPPPPGSSNFCPRSNLRAIRGRKSSLLGTHATQGLNGIIITIVKFVYSFLF